jgi:class 3 adenylate cyclase
LAEKILHSRSALEGERKQVTVLFADLKGSLELLADRDPEEARQLLDPVLERKIDAVHCYEGMEQPEPSTTKVRWPCQHPSSDTWGCTEAQRRVNRSAKRSKGSFARAWQ